MSTVASTKQHVEMTHAACAVCDGDDFRFLFTKNGRDFWRCRSCGMERQWPLPTMAELAAYYEQSYRDGMYQAFAAAEQMKRLTAAARYRQIARHCRPGRWLDVGCSNGVFLEEVLTHDLAGEGVELSPVAADEARKKGLTVHCGTLEETPAEPQFDTVTAFDVLEHVLDPLAFVMAIHERLAPGGTAAVSVPNLHSFSRWLMGRRWYFYIPEEHLHYFSPGTLARLLTRAGFAVLRRRPTYKPLTFDYSLVQFREYNPWIYRPLNVVAKVIPKSLRNMVVPLYIGETLVIARKL